MCIKKYITFMALSSLLVSNAQNNTPKTFVAPFDFPLTLSANFGELRSNHFHGGIDFKTMGEVGKPIHCIADGYVSRILIMPGGYGQAIFIVHPNGYTSVYGHVKSFVPSIEKIVEDYQLKHETFSADLKFEPDIIKFKSGDIIAFSGNEGYSFGPHLHMEIRKSDTDEFIDPLQFYKDKVKDTRAPQATAVVVYPQKGKGIINGSSNKKTIPVASLNQGATVWGEIGFGIKAFDYMDGTYNHYGVYKVSLFVDNERVFTSIMNGILPDENRMINAYIDYEEFKKRNSWIMRSYSLPGNTLRNIETSNNRGIININQERDYNIRYELEDLYGNKKDYSFKLTGKPSNIEPYIVDERNVLRWNKSNVVQEPGLELIIPKGMLYDDVEMNLEIKSDSTYIANVYKLHDIPVPLHSYCSLMIGLRKMPVKDSTKYYIASVIGNNKNYIGGTYMKGWMKTDIRELGTYTVAIDTVAPKIIPLYKNQWRNGNIQFRVSDSETGIKNHKVYIDGKFYIFKYDLKNSKIIMKYPQRLPKGMAHKMDVIIEDRCGNIKRENYLF